MSNARGILALDLARITGWAFGVDGLPPRYGFVRLGEDGAPPGRRMSQLVGWMEDFMTVSRPELVIYEAPVPKIQTSARGLIYLCGAVEMVCSDMSIECREEHSQTVRKLVLGRGAFFTVDAAGKKVSDTKNQAVAWAQAQGWDPATHDVADALVLLRYAHSVRRMRRAA